MFGWAVAFGESSCELWVVEKQLWENCCSQSRRPFGATLVAFESINKWTPHIIHNPYTQLSPSFSDEWTPLVSFSFLLLSTRSSLTSRKKLWSLIIARPKSAKARGACRPPGLQVRPAARKRSFSPGSSSLGSSPHLESRGERAEGRLASTRRVAIVARGWRAPDGDEGRWIMLTVLG